MMNQIDMRRSVPSFDVQRDGSAYQVSVIRRTEYSADLEPSTTMAFPLAEGIEASDWTSGVLSVKYSARTAWPTSASARVVVENMAIVPNEPQTTFVEASPAVATSLWTQGTAGNNRLSTVAFSGAIGPQLRVVLRLSTALTAGIVGVTLTVDLVGRTG